MSRLTITLTAAAASALVAAATVALPAIGDEGSSGSDGAAAFAACLRDHGLPGAPSAAGELKPWLAAREAQDPRAVKTALAACETKAAKPKPADGVAVRRLVACLRAHGLDAPSDPLALKRWLAGKEADDSDAIKRVVPDCKAQLAPPADEAIKPNACGEEGAAKPAQPATEPEAPPEQTT